MEPVTFECMRCGSRGEFEEMFYVEVYNGIAISRVLDIRICEQCFQTIKEVLQDGDIK